MPNSYDYSQYGGLPVERIQRSARNISATFVRRLSPLGHEES